MVEKKTKGVFEISDLKLTNSRGSFVFFKIIISFTEILKKNKENKKSLKKLLSPNSISL